MDRKINEERESKEVTEASKIAKFYGFTPIQSPTLTKGDLDLVKAFDKSVQSVERASILRMYTEEKMMALPQPVMLYCERPFPGSKEISGESKKHLWLESSIMSVGSYKSVCECLSIETAIAILNHLGFKNLEIEVNSIGDKDSINEFNRQMSSYVRKNYSYFPADLRQAIKRDPFVLLREEKEEWKNFQAESPKSIDFLSEQSRAHFKEVLEFLEIMNAPYSINHFLLGDTDIGSETVFRIIEKEKDEVKTLANGFRYNRLAKKIDFKKEIPCTTLNISVKLKKVLKRVKPRVIKPQFYLVQFGSEAKLRSFVILKELYKAGACVLHSIAKDKLSSQMGFAESGEIPYILLIGQKEALENCVVIRNTSTRAQEIVPIHELAVRVKELE